ALPTSNVRWPPPSLTCALGITLHEYRHANITESPLVCCRSFSLCFACLPFHPRDHGTQSGQRHAPESQNRIRLARCSVRRRYSVAACCYLYRSCPFEIC